MKEYNITVETTYQQRYNITAESEETATERAKQLSKQQGTDGACIIDRTPKVWHAFRVTAKESARRKREAVREFVADYLEGIDKEELADIAFRGQSANWLEWVGEYRAEDVWKDELFRAISDCTEPNTDRWERYLTFAARLRFRRECGKYQQPFAAHVTGCEKDQKKQAVVDALRVLTVGEHEQIVVRYRDHLTDNPENYWNLFISENDDEHGRYYYAWQYVKADGDIDDFNTEYFDIEDELLHDIFYCPRYDDDPTSDNITDVWVD